MPLKRGVRRTGNPDVLSKQSFHSIFELATHTISDYYHPSIRCLPRYPVKGHTGYYGTHYCHLVWNQKYCEMLSILYIIK